MADFPWFTSQMNLTQMLTVSQLFLHLQLSEFWLTKVSFPASPRIKFSSFFASKFFPTKSLSLSLSLSRNSRKTRMCVSLLVRPKFILNQHALILSKQTLIY